MKELLPGFLFQPAYLDLGVCQSSGGDDLLIARKKIEHVVAPLYWLAGVKPDAPGWPGSAQPQRVRIQAG